MKERFYRLSPFVHQLPSHSDEYEILYNALTLGLVVIKKNVIQLINRNLWQEINSTTLRHLQIIKAIIPIEKTGFEELKEIRKFFERNILGVLCLMLTESCNLRCRYCFIEHKFTINHKFNSMTFDMAKLGIDVFIKHLPESLDNGLVDPTISFYGGEPLLNLSVFEKALEYISTQKQKDKDLPEIFLTLNTNGTLISSKIARLLKKYKVSVSLSIDGTQPIHDSARRDRENKGSFKRVIAGLELLREYGIDVGISCAVAMHNLRDLEDIAVWFMDELEVDVFGFNILVVGGLPEPNFDLYDYSLQLGEKMVRCFQSARARNKQEERSFRLAKSFADGKIHYYDCSACGQQLVVDPRGRFGPCHAYLHGKKNFISPNSSINLFSHPLWQEWKTRSPLNIEPCLKCIALGICGGGCPYNAGVRKGSIWELDEGFCPFAQSMTKFLVTEVAQKTIINYNKGC
jgi:uncharacterized protein